MNEITKMEIPYDKIVKGYKYNDDYLIIEGADFPRTDQTGMGWCFPQNLSWWTHL